MPDKPFPRYCPACGKNEVIEITMPYTTQVLYHGIHQQIHISNFVTPQCRVCKELFFGNRSDDQISQAMQSQLG